MADKLDDLALDQLFRTARTHNGWTDRPVTDEQLRELYDILKLGPTSANSSPARFVWVRSAEGKSRLSALASTNNQAKILAAPVTVIIGYDLDFPETFPKLFPNNPKMKDMFAGKAEMTHTVAFRNGSLQGAYFIVAARALGLDCGPMSGFNNAGVDAEFFAGTSIKSNFICALGHGDPGGVFPRNPRLSFDEACKII